LIELKRNPKRHKAGGTRDREELGQALDRAEDNRFEAGRSRHGNPYLVEIVTSACKEFQAAL
jgi:hypothetical protein